MTAKNETPFDSVEGAHEYLSLLSQAIQDARDEIEADIRGCWMNEWICRLRSRSSFLITLIIF